MFNTSADMILDPAYAPESTKAIPQPPPSTRARAYDIRARQEILHRRQFYSVVRRLVRVVGLHAVDGVLLVSVALLVSGVAYGEPGMRAFVPAIVGIFLVSLNASASYKAGDARRDRLRLLAGVMMGSTVLALLTVFPPHLPLTWSLGGMLLLLTLVALAAGRKAVDLLVRQFYLHGIGLRRAVLIGTLDEVGTAIQQLRDDENADQYLVGHLSPDGHSDPTALGMLNDLPDLLANDDVQEVIVASPLPASSLRQVAEWCFDRGIVLFIFPSVVGSVDCQVEPVRVGSCPLLHLYPSRMKVPSLMVKRSFDWLMAALAILVLLPAMLLIALVIRMDSKGPIFFRQERVGRNGRRFRIWKFRSMRADAEEIREKLAHMNAYDDPRLFKVANDPRVTPVGRFLRRSSLDELPQLFNVLNGEMSLVGPRPPLPAEVEKYESHHLVRLAVVPGITGPWQVNGRNLITDFEEVVRLERAYINSWTIWSDLKILARTVPVVISGEGAY
ncbi:MAG: sugar transferase [Gemmatimonadetes bacterium]|nr:sugar transferase [Gemmatimonadota bacterium]